MNDAAADLCDLLRPRFLAVEERIAAACNRARRARSEVTLVCVTKTVSSAVAGLLPSIGILDLGENRPQELWRKAAVLPATVRWHLIGHLQRNKIERTLPLVHLIHSVDSVRLLEALEDAASRESRKPKIEIRNSKIELRASNFELRSDAPRFLTVLLEVNASREPSKHGFAPEELLELAPRLSACRHVRLHGLMTMAALEESPEKARPTFASVRILRDRLREMLKPPHDFRQLSMGMSNDFEIAIEEGATLVRIGSALFADLPREVM